MARTTTLLGLLSTLLSGLVVVGCSAPEKSIVPSAANVPDFSWPNGPHPIAVLRVEGPELQGEIELELYPELAPSTVDNFVKLAEEGFYSGTTFHRVVPEMMIQGGDPNSKDHDPRNDGQGNAGYWIKDEFTDAPYLRGVLSMANTGNSDSGSCQFFIMNTDVPHMNGRYSVFGRVISGIEVVDAISAVEVDKYGRWGPADRPLTNIVLESVSIRTPDETGAQAEATKAERDPSA